MCKKALYIHVSMNINNKLQKQYKERTLNPHLTRFPERVKTGLK